MNRNGATSTHSVSRFIGQTIALEFENGAEVLITFEALRSTQVRLLITVPGATAVNAPRDIGFLKSTRQLTRRSDGWLISEPREAP